MHFVICPTGNRTTAFQADMQVSYSVMNEILKGMTRYFPSKYQFVGTLLHLKEHILKFKKNPALGQKSEKLTKKSLFGNSSHSDEFHDFYL